MEKTKKYLLLLLPVLIHLNVQAQQGLSFPGQTEWAMLGFLLRSPDPGLADSLLSKCQKEDYSAIYHSSDRSLRTLQSEEAIIHYFTLLKSNCGALRLYEQKRYAVQRSKGSKHKIITANYSLEFDSLNADAVAVFQVISRKKIRMSSFVVTLNSTVRIAALDTVSKKTLRQLKNREYQAIYDSASSGFKTQASIEDFHKLFEQIDPIDPEIYSLKKSQLGFEHGHYLFSQTWSSAKDNYSLTLIYERVQGVFQLKGIDYSTLNEHKQ